MNPDDRASFVVTTRRRGAEVAVVAAGEMDVGTAYRLESHVTGAAGTGDAVTLDLGGVSFLDSSGLRALLRLRQEGMRTGWRMRIVAAHPNVRRLLEMTGADRILGLDPDPDHPSA